MAFLGNTLCLCRRWPDWPVSAIEHEPGSLEEAWETMAALQREGKVRFIGAADFSADQLLQLHQLAPATSLQAPYSLLQRSIEGRTFAFCASHAIGVLASSPLRSGLLTGRLTPNRINTLPYNDWRRRHRCFQKPCVTNALPLIDRLRVTGERYSRTAAEVALSWTLRHDGVTAVTVGARHAKQVDEIVRAASLELTATDIDELERGAQQVGVWSR